MAEKEKGSELVVNSNGLSSDLGSPVYDLTTIWSPASSLELNNAYKRLSVQFSFELFRIVMDFTIFLERDNGRTRIYIEKIYLYDYGEGDRNVFNYILLIRRNINSVLSRVHFFLSPSFYLIISRLGLGVLHGT